MRKLLAFLASIVLLPVRLIDGTIKYVLQRLSPPSAPIDDETAVAAQAAQQAHAQQERADAAMDARELVQHLRRVLLARSRGQVPDPEHASRLPENLFRYVTALSQDECAKLVAMPTARLRDLMDGKPIEGIRSPDQLASAPADELAARRAARREDVRERLRSRSAEDIIEEVRITA